MIGNSKAEELAGMLNTIILSMASKQRLFDNLNSEIFKCDIFSGYIDLLIQVNLKLLDKEFEKTNYLKLIDDYLSNKIDREEIIDKIKKNS